MDQLAPSFRAQPALGRLLPAAEPSIEVRSLSKTFSARSGDVHAVRDASFSVSRGEFVAIMGPSGSGKSTLLRIVGALDVPSSGNVAIEGVDLSELDACALAALRRRTIGYVFQEYNLLTGLTSMENVAAPLELDGMRSAAARAIALEHLDAVGLADRYARFPDDLSGGERQRVAIARALVGDRRVVLADEPTGSLDSETGESIVGVLRSITERRLAVVIVTHDAAVADQADRIMHMSDGVLTADRPGTSR
jgi:putative ABC transport system ATP-binding protein